MTSKAIRQLLALFLAMGCGFAGSAKNVQSGDETAIRALLEHYFAAYAKEDIEAIGRLWSDRSPDLAPAKDKLKEFFSTNKQIEIRNLRFRQLNVDLDHATALVTMEFAAVDSNTNKPQLGLGKRSQNINLIKEGGVWKIQRDSSAEAELAARLVAAKSDEERATLLAADKELLTIELRKALLQQNGTVIRKGNYAQALAIFELTGKIAQEINDTIGLAHVSIGVGYVRRLQGNLNPSMDSYQKALASCEKLGDRECVSTSLIGIGIIHHIRSDYRLAAEYYRKALVLSEELGQKNNIANALQNLGLVQKDSGNYAEALDYYQKSLSIFEAINDRPGIANSLGNIARVHILRGDIDASLTYLQKSLAVNEQLGDRGAIANQLNEIGTSHNRRGNLGEAMSFFQRALAINEELGNKRGIAYALGNIATVHYQQGNLPLALEYHQKSIALEESVGDKAAMVAGLNNLGLVYSGMGDIERAIECYQKSLSINETARNKSGASSALTNLAEVYRSQGKYDLAFENYRKSLQLKEEIGDRATTGAALANMGLAYYQQGNPARAMEYLARAIVVCREFGNRGTLWRALTTAGNTYLALGQPQKASESFREAIATTEELRAEAGGGEQELQRSFEKNVSPYYRMVELLVSQGKTGEALSYAERAKARVLLDVMQSGKVNITKAMTNEEKADEQNIRGTLVSLNARLSRESRRSQPDQTQLAELTSELQKARLDHQDFQSRLYASHPELKVRRGEAHALTEEEAEKLLGDAKIALLEYAVADDKTFLFVLTANAAGNGLQQPILKAYELAIKRSDLAERVQKLTQRIAANDLDYAALASELYNLLVGPARQQLQGKTRMVIVPDDVLWDTPFQALRTTDGRFLLQTAEISYAPSLTVLREIGRSRKTKATTTLLAMGNPRLTEQTVSRSKKVLMSASFEPLPEAERMVRGLEQIYGAKASKVYVGDEAREEVLKAEARNYQILQLATHGVINNASPMYSYVALAQNNNAQEDGLLEAWEIMGLDLQAELAVLSACETARGKIGAGEGVIGLAWALFVAGCPTTVVSQWKVESSSTTELMLGFHRNLRAGASKSEALRQASLKLMTDKRYNHPFYWAGFIVVGDPR